MKTNIEYDFQKSRDRIDEILVAVDASFEEVESIPVRDRLTYTNGFFVNCTALFVDIRESSGLTEKHTRPVLAKIYRAFISEVTAIMNGNTDCSQISIEGDCVWGMFDTPHKEKLDSVFNTALKISSIVDILNCKLKSHKIEPISIGIGISYGRALMIKAGFNGSGINDVVWMGDVVNEAARLCDCGGKTENDLQIMVSEIIYNSLNEDNKELLEWNRERWCYQGDDRDPEMNNWYLENCAEE